MADNNGCLTCRQSPLQSDMVTKNELLDEVTTHYLSSCDFNGMPVHCLPNFNLTDLEELISDGKVFILSESRVNNIHINCYNSFGSVPEQIEAIHSKAQYAVYPSAQHLKTVNIQEEKPFTKMLMQGTEQLRILYFSVDALEVYANNPQYTFQDHGYRGNICVNGSANENDPIHSEYIQDFGIAYPKAEPHDQDRAIAVFLRDLSKLNYRAQCKWMGFLLPDQDEFLVNYGFIQNLVYGEWITEHWIFNSLLEEIKFINVLCQNIGIPQLFCNEYSMDTQELIGYRIILIPSLKNYYDFVSTLEKITINNLNYKTFQNAAPYIRPIKRKKSDGSLKGSIEMLEEWMKQNYLSSLPNGIDYFREDVSNTLRKIRKIRQAPAHELYSNQHDKGLYRKQNEHIREIYHAMEVLRLILSSHPLNKNIPLPDVLKDRTKIVVY